MGLGQSDCNCAGKNEHRQVCTYAGVHGSMDAPMQGCMDACMCQSVSQSAGRQVGRAVGRSAGRSVCVGARIRAVRTCVRMFMYACMHVCMYACTHAFMCVRKVGAHACVTSHGILSSSNGFLWAAARVRRSSSRASQKYDFVFPPLLATSLLDHYPPPKPWRHDDVWCSSHDGTVSGNRHNMHRNEHNIAECQRYSNG